MGELAFLANSNQQACDGLFDRRLRTMVPLMVDLLCYREVFHAQLFFHSEQLLLWRFGSPYHFEVYPAPAVLAADFCDNFGRYEIDGLQIAPHDVARTLVKMAWLRQQGTLLSLGINRASGTVGACYTDGHCHWGRYSQFLAG